MMPPRVQVSRSDIAIECDGRTLAARRFGRDDPAARGPAILFLHGLHSDQAGYQPRAEAVASHLGVVCLTFDLGGHGRSDGVRDDLSPHDHLHEAIAAYDALGALGGVDPQRVGVCAASYGAYLAALLVARRPVQRLFLRAPALYPDDWLDVPLHERGRLGGPPPDSAALASVGRFEGEILVLESGSDEVIPHATIEAYLRACPGARHEVIAGATHRLAEPAWNARFVELMLEWFTPL
jgi:pimeloyl-ACP methyl ester carboxylesterase